MQFTFVVQASRLHFPSRRDACTTIIFPEPLMLKRTLCACVCLSVLAGAIRASADDRSIETTAKKTLQTYGKSVILLSAVLKAEIKGRELSIPEQKTQCTAAIIDADGLAVTAMSNLMPKMLPAAAGKSWKSNSRFRR